MGSNMAQMLFFQLIKSYLNVFQKNFFIINVIDFKYVDDLEYKLNLPYLQL